MLKKSIWSDYQSFLLIDKSLSENSIKAYISDVERFLAYLSEPEKELELKSIELSHLKKFIEFLNSLEISPRSQARIISGIRSFFKYLLPFFF